MNSRHFILITSVILIAFELFSYADTIVLKDGRKIEGFIVEEQADSYIVKIKIGTIKLDKESIKEVKRLSPEENYLNLGNQYLVTKNYDAALEQYKKALEVNPEFEPAKKAVAQIEKLKGEVEKKKREEIEKKRSELLEKKEKVRNGFGMELEIIDEELKVLTTESNLPAEIAGIRPADVITQIDEQTTKDRSLEDILNYLLRPDTIFCKFTILRKVDLSRKLIEYQNRPLIGVGVFLEVDPNGLVISSVMPREPADLAGLRTGDRIITIDGRPTKGIPLDQASNLLSGADGTKVGLTVQRSVELERR